MQRNLSNFELTTDQVNLLSRGLKFVPTPITNETALRKQLLTEFKDFAGRMRLQYIYHGEDIYVIYRPGGPYIGKNCARGLEYGPRPQAEGRTQDQGHSFSLYGPT